MGKKHFGDQEAIKAGRQLGEMLAILRAEYDLDDVKVTQFLLSAASGAALGAGFDLGRFLIAARDVYRAVQRGVARVVVPGVKS